MSERVRLGDDRAQRGAGAASSAEPELPGYPARHCWVLDPADGTLAKRAGLLLEWRRGADGWEGQVAYLCRRPGRGWLVTLEWFPERALEVAVLGSS